MGVELQLWRGAGSAADWAFSAVAVLEGKLEVGQVKEQRARVPPLNLRLFVDL